MKRFFKPVEKERPCKKPICSSSSPKRESDESKASLDEENKQTSKKEPVKFVTWNANSLLLRIKSSWSEFTKFVENVDPDIIAVQEVRMPAAGAKGASRNPGELKDDTSSSREEKQIVLRALSKLPFKDYNVWWSLSDSKYAGTGLFIKKCYQPKKIHFSLEQTDSMHESDGRVILAEFESFVLLNTYVPNNGWKEEESSFRRRRKWDKRMLEFVTKNGDKPLIWCGDLNVSHQDIDVSHPVFFNEAKLNGYVPPNKEDYGQPGFTLSERKRFGSILQEGKLLDVYRYLHPDKDMERGFSWSGNPVGKYRGKRMRIDYFIVSDKLRERIVSCEMHGHGIELEGFYGSDHCPLSLVLSDVGHIRGEPSVAI